MWGKPDVSRSQAPSFLAGGGQMGGLIRAFDWGSTPLGRAEQWPESLRVAVRIMLTSRQPIWIGWGEELTYLYNDAYLSIIGGKHPWALGRPTRQVWREIWGDIEPLLSTALGGVEGTYVEEQFLIMERNGYPEETYYTFSYSPIPGADGAPGGIICANTDDTKRVIGERQLRLLRDLATRTIDARSRQEAYERSALALENDQRDIPFALLYAKTQDCDVWSLSGSTGFAESHPAALSEIDSRDSPWPLAMADGRGAAFCDGLSDRFGQPFPTGGWDRPCNRAAIIAIPEKSEGREGRLIVGLNPCRLFGESYRTFLELVVGQISIAIASADAYEQERRRSEALAELDRAKTVFFSNVSHEFRTPLTLMLGPLHDLLFSAEPLAPRVRDAAEAAHRNGLRLLRMVNSLLDFSRMEAGRVRATYTPMDLGAFSAEIASSFRSAIEGAGLKLRIALAPLPKPAYVDREMWEKILLNLLSNAFKFTLEGEIALSVAGSADGLNAIVKVSDTGVGIPAEELPRLFERFHRIEGQRGRSIEGSGIGLALVNDLVKLHGGEIAVESAPGKGTTFTISLPLGRSHLPAEQVRVEAPEALRSSIAHEYLAEASRWMSSVDAAPADLHLASHRGVASSFPWLERGRIVLAEDNADMRDYVSRLLGASCDMRAVGDGEAALEAIRTEAPDLIITDVMMPRLDGFGLLRAIRSADETSELPVILLSARAGEEARIEGLEAGADDYLVKPFSANELVARVNAKSQAGKNPQGGEGCARALRGKAARAERGTGAASGSRGRRTDEGRGCASPGPEDGGHRPIDGGSRARFQQSTHPHHRRSRDHPAQKAW